MSAWKNVGAALAFVEQVNDPPTAAPPPVPVPVRAGVPNEHVALVVISVRVKLARAAMRGSEISGSASVTLKTVRVDMAQHVVDTSCSQERADAPPQVAKGGPAVHMPVSERQPRSSPVVVLRTLSVISPAGLPSCTRGRLISTSAIRTLSSLEQPGRCKELAYSSGRSYDCSRAAE